MRLKNLTTLRGKNFIIAKKTATAYFLKNVIILIAENKLFLKRVGLIVSKKIGNAVTRNFVKRRFRMILSTLAPTLAKGFDIVLIARFTAATSKFSVLTDEISNLLCKRFCNV